MATVASRYARAKQRALETTGHLFERRYHARLIDGERYLLALVRYIHLNPVRASMVADPADYRWSSHRAYLAATGPAWLEVGTVLDRLATTREAARTVYRDFMGMPPGEHDRRELSATGNAGSRRNGSLPVRSGNEPGRASLEAIAGEEANAHGVSLEALRSTYRGRDVVVARAAVARRALAAGAANLTQVARFLNRAPSTISDLLARDR